MKFVCPLIVVSNIQASKKFYEDVLQQKIKVDFVENITFEGDFAIHQKTHFQDLIDGKEIKQGGNNAELYFELDDMDAFSKTLEEHAIELVHPMREQPWRQRVVRFYDPDKHIIEVGESMEFVAYRLSKEGKSISEISKTTYLPIEAVKMAIEKYE